MEQGGMRVEDFVYAIKKRYKIILLIIGFVGIVLFMLYGRDNSAQYNSEVKIEYEINSKIYIHNADKNLGINDNVIDARAMNSFSEVLKSTSFMKSVLDECNSSLDINTIKNTFWIILIPDTQVIKLAIIGDNKDELLKVLQQFQTKAIETAPLIIENSEVQVIEDIGVVGATELLRTKANNTNKIIVIMGLSILGSFLLVFLLEYLDDTVKSGRDIESYFEVPLIGKVGKKNEKSDIVKIRTAIKYSSYDIVNNVIAIANIDNSKNTNIANELAISLSNIDYKILKISSDESNSNYNLMDLLSGKNSLEEIINMSNNNLDTISLGVVEGRSIDFLDSKKMDVLILELKEKYECIIIEVDEIKNSEVSQILAAKCDAAILVANNKTKIKALEKSILIIKNLNTSIIGVILN